MRNGSLTFETEAQDLRLRGDPRAGVAAVNQFRSPRAAFTRRLRSGKERPPSRRRGRARLSSGRLARPLRAVFGRAKSALPPDGAAALGSVQVASRGLSAPPSVGPRPPSLQTARPRSGPF